MTNLHVFVLSFLFYHHYEYYIHKMRRWELRWGRYSTISTCGWTGLLALERLSYWSQGRSASLAFSPSFIDALVALDMVDTQVQGASKDTLLYFHYMEVCCPPL